jgi:membrane-bound lytic murein transglycosylase D
MKRLFVSVFLLCSLNAANAAPKLFRDSSRTFVQSRDGIQDTIMVPVLNAAQVNPYQGSIYKRRLDSIQKEVPLDYNAYVQSYIDTYLNGSQRESLGRILVLTKYYFPIYEKVFHDAGIPEEIKYLSIVESQLNPNAVSRVGATGPWQFMGPTAKIYGLNIDSYVDERRDPIQSSYAAAAYLKDAYQQFGDWLTAIASYNCGKSNVL